MELSRYELAAVKRTAQIIKPKRAKLSKLFEKKKEIDAQIDDLQKEIDLWEAPIITKHGYSSEQILSGEADSMEETNSSSTNFLFLKLFFIYDLVVFLVAHLSSP